MESRVYLCVDLKSFYASVECVERKLDPMTTNLVVADISRTEKTICLAVSPSLKAYGIPGRPRLFEVIQGVAKANEERRRKAGALSDESFDADALKASPQLALSYITAPPRMALYMEYSTRIYNVYLKYIAPEDIHIYSVDEVFIDLTSYLKTYALTAPELARRMIHDVYATTGITATAGMGTNLYLCKIAMDIVAKRAEPDEFGVRMAQLDEQGYRRLLWSYRPLTAFWRVGRGYAKKLEANGIYTMGDVARCSVENEDKLYSLFGINAELLIDHAWGWEPCTMAEIKAYKPSSSSICAGQVLTCPYPFEKARLVSREMAEQMALDLAGRGLTTDQLTLTVGYDIENLTDARISAAYTGEVTVDNYGRCIPKQAHGTENLERTTVSSRLITAAAVRLFDRIVNKNLLVRRLYLVANHIVPSDEREKSDFMQQDMFSALDAAQNAAAEESSLEREKRMQQAMLAIKKKYGKNAVVRGMNLEEGATAIERNGQIGGHKA